MNANSCRQCCHHCSTVDRHLKEPLAEFGKTLGLEVIEEA